MSDRTAVQLRVVQCPPNRVRAVLDLIDWHRLQPPERIAEGSPTEDQLALGTLYMCPEVCCGSAQEIATCLVKAAPEGAWEVWEDPKYEWLGDLYRFTPELGLWSEECSSTGTPVFSDDQIVALLDDDTLSRRDIDRKLGRDHAAALAALQAQHEHLVLTAEPHQEDED